MFVMGEGLYHMWHCGETQAHDLADLSHELGPARAIIHDVFASNYHLRCCRQQIPEIPMFVHNPIEKNGQVLYIYIYKLTTCKSSPFLSISVFFRP